MKKVLIKKPIIGISTNLLKMEVGEFVGLERMYVNHEYITSVVKAEAVPLMLPIILDLDSIRRQIEIVDGIILSGGQDVSPLLYGEEPYQLLGSTSLERDEYDVQLVKIAYEMGKPILGVCRGLQLLNTAFGGTLYQDLSLHEPKSTIQHNQKAKQHSATHTVEIVDKTKLQHIFGKKTLVTNSFHHQAVKQVAPGFVVNALAKDGVIEGIEKLEGPFVLGVQWHPEMMTAINVDMEKLFDAFVAEAIRTSMYGR